MKSYAKYIPHLLVVIGFFMISIPLWLKVDVLPMRLWDESRNAVNAIEMYFSGNLITRTFNYAPETYNLKPPLLTWLQVVCIHIFGINELAIRFPSLLASIGSVIMLFLLVRRITKDCWFSFLAAGILGTSSGFYGEHVGRFGDHDALLVFFTLGFIYSIYSYSIGNSVKHVHLSGMFICLGILCKSIAILAIIPGVFLFLLSQKQVLPLLKNKHLYVAMLLAAAPIAIYYWLREKAQPGFLLLVWNDELFPRYLNTSSNLEFANESFWYYFNLLFREQMSYWLWLTPAVVLAPFVSKQKNGWWFLLITVSTYLIVLSNGTKNFWYDAPSIPLLAALLAVSLFAVYKRFFNLPKALGVLVLGLLVFPFNNAYLCAQNASERHYEWETNGISHFLKDEDHLANLSSNTQILLDDVCGFEPYLFYIKKLKYQKGLKINRTYYDRITSNDTLLVSHKSVFNSLGNDYIVTVLDSSAGYTKLVALAPKDTLIQIDPVSNLSSIE
jgi:4-amino-4-deoxy-L-arabinose transferase-like glycosyltransferase